MAPKRSTTDPKSPPTSPGRPTSPPAAAASSHMAGGEKELKPAARPRPSRIVLGLGCLTLALVGLLHLRAAASGDEWAASFLAFGLIDWTSSRTSAVVTHAKARSAINFALLFLKKFVNFYHWVLAVFKKKSMRPRL